MAPRKLSDEQLEEIRLMLEAFTTGLQEALQTTVTTALQTVLRDQQIHHEARRANPQEQHQQHNLQHQRQRHEAPHDSSDEEDMMENSNRWESSFRTNIPEFNGSLNPEDFIDWINVTEEILEFRQVPEDVRVSLVATRFKGRAMAWWQQLKDSRRQENKPRISTWERLTKHMRRAFLPFNYERTLYNNKNDIKRNGKATHFALYWWSTKSITDSSSPIQPSLDFGSTSTCDLYGATTPAILVLVNEKSFPTECTERQFRTIFA
ncbi:hypothetical protein Rs2_39168 [Raphanus sativus]|nr:hypothetical protein Rs2_39168 [Raphanus sativus]